MEKSSWAYLRLTEQMGNVKIHGGVLTKTKISFKKKEKKKIAQIFIDPVKFLYGSVG